MAATNSRLSYAICYGFASGPKNGAALQKALEAAGYKLVPIDKADIVIAHSAGCWLLPRDIHPRLVMYVGMPLQQTTPGKTWFEANTKHNTLSRRQLARSRAIHSYYLVREPRRNVRLIKDAKRLQPSIIENTPTIFIANHHDPWPHAPILETYLETYPWDFISLPGTHNDIWTHPDAYVDIIDHYARLLAKTDV
jgi:hypothetical protein